MISIDQSMGKITFIKGLSVNITLIDRLAVKVTFIHWLLIKVTLFDWCNVGGNSYRY